MKKLIVGISSESSVVLIEGQLKYFKERGYDPYLLGPYSERVRKYCELEGCKYLHVNIKRDISLLNDFLTLLEIFKLFHQVKPDIINLGTPKVSLLGMVIGWFLQIKIRIYTCRGFRYEHETGFKRKVLIKMEKITANCAHKIICISPSLREYGIKNGIFGPEKSIVIKGGSSNGIDLKRFSPEKVSYESKIDLKRNLGIENMFVFGFVGRIIDRKGINELYKAFTKLSEKLYDIVLLLVGSFEEEQIADKEIINLINTHEQIKYLGPQKNIPLLLSVMDVFILPAWWEGFGNVLIQAAAMGIPVISTNATGTKDAVNQNFNGLLVDPRSIEQLEKAMILLHEKKEMRETLGRNGLEWARNFDNMIIWQGMEEIYNSVI